MPTKIFTLNEKNPGMTKHQESFLHLPRGLVHGDSSWRDLSHKILPKLKNIHCYWQWPFLTWQCRNVSFFVYVMSSLGGFFWGPKSLRLKHGRACFTTKGCCVGLVELLFLLGINGTIMTYHICYMKFTIYSNILLSMLLVDPEHPGTYQIYIYIYVYLYICTYTKH